MPIYEYQCKSCGQISEVLVHSFFSPQSPECPVCGHEMERRLSSPVVIEKGKHSGATCCGREERCEKPPCSSDNHCRRT